MVTDPKSGSMTMDDANGTGWLLTRATLVRAYAWLTALALAVFLVALFRPSVLPSLVTNTVVGVWLLSSVVAFAHAGIENSTHGA